MGGKKEENNYLKLENTKNTRLPDIFYASQSNQGEKKVAINVLENSLNQVIVK